MIHVPFKNMFTLSFRLFPTTTAQPSSSFLRMEMKECVHCRKRVRGKAIDITIYSIVNIGWGKSGRKKEREAMTTIRLSNDFQFIHLWIKHERGNIHKRLQDKSRKRKSEGKKRGEMKGFDRKTSPFLDMTIFDTCLSFLWFLNFFLLLVGKFSHFRL